MTARKSLVETLMDRDNISRTEAQKLENEARTEMIRRIDEGEDTWDICEEYFGLEPDYLEDLLF
jgi:hypothetical protein